MLYSVCMLCALMGAVTAMFFFFLLDIPGAVGQKLLHREKKKKREIRRAETPEAYVETAGKDAESAEATARLTADPGEQLFILEGERNG